MRITKWDFSSTLPNPLYGCTVGQCSVALSLSNGSTFWGTELENSKEVTSAKTIGELGLVMQRKGIWFGKTHVKDHVQGSDLCALAGYMINGGNHSSRLPGGRCTLGELPPTVCSFDMPSIELRHTEYDTTVNGSRASGRINVTCTQPMKVTIKGQYSGVDSIVLDSKSKFESVLTLNDQPLSRGVKLNASSSPTTVTITSTLKGTPPPGEYQGSTVIIITVQ
ncbi:hypothetical protein EKN38_19410 [Enterobacter sp. WCHEn045836]|uniref:MrpH family fimbial adhesin n=1 Tax=Enterobacter sp. WCHEn045836 TaxID=2497434 RepID=UPI000F83B49B|nr:hypothetical protein [Enterobacter sp. WCHEn045836]RTP99427.1 hypothetical protein EKN38_19410 [Enterobacter sp. WCHEn045836]